MSGKKFKIHKCPEKCQISGDRNVRAFSSSSCGGVVIGKVLQVNIARVNPCPSHESFWAWSGLRIKYRLERKELATIKK